MVVAQEQILTKEELFKVENENVSDYCKICKDHTMCLNPVSNNLMQF